MSKYKFIAFYIPFLLFSKYFLESYFTTRKCSPLSIQCKRNNSACCSLVTLIYFINADSVLCPVICIIDNVGKPLKYKFVAKERRAK